MGIGTFLNGRDPEALRGLQFFALSEVAEIQTLQSTSDSGGGATRSWVSMGTFPCRIDPLSASAAGMTGGQIDERSTHLVTTTTSAQPASSGQVVIPNRGTYEVTATRDRTAGVVVQFEVIQIF